MDDLSNPHQLFRRMFAEVDKWFPLDQWQKMMDQLNNQIQVTETNNEYQVMVALKGIEKPNDIEAQFYKGHLHLNRTVQLEKKTDHDQGAVWQSYYEQFQRMVPLTHPIRWAERKITVQNGIWKIQLPKL